MTIEAKDPKAGVTEFTLPSGIKVEMKRGKGKHLITATRIAGKDVENITTALAAVLCTFDGQVKVMEDILELDIADFGEIQLQIQKQIEGPLSEGGK